MTACLQIYNSDDGVAKENNHQSDDVGWGRRNGIQHTNGGWTLQAWAVYPQTRTSLYWHTFWQCGRCDHRR